MNESLRESDRVAEEKSSVTRSSFTGRRREKKNRWTVKFTDRVAQSLITVGGIGTIVAILLVFVFLAWVVVPLLLPSRFETAAYLPQTLSPGRHFVKVITDEYRQLVWSVDDQAHLRLARVDTGKMIEEKQLVEKSALTAAAFSLAGDEALFALTDGTIKRWEFSFQTSYHDEPNGTSSRQQQFSAVEKETLTLPSNTPLQNLDFIRTGSGLLFATLDRKGNVGLHRLEEHKNFLTGAVLRQLQTTNLPAALAVNDLPARVLLSGGLGDNLLLIWNDGRLSRFDIRDYNQPLLVEQLDLLPDPNLQVTAAQFILGHNSLAVGDSQGQVSVWFRSKPSTATTRDGILFSAAHLLKSRHASAVTALTPSLRNRLLAVGHADGGIELFQVTSDHMIAALFPSDKPLPIEALAIAPKEDGIIALTAVQITNAALNMRHPEANLRSLFQRIWYEGYSKPEHVWQSSSGSDDFEPKLGLMPLVFGTLKATFYSMLFGVPIAMLAAIYTSEFLHPKSKALVKPAIEMMASLPSVVLGFLAALVFAPLVEQVLPSLLTAFLVVPFVFLTGAYLWQLLPADMGMRLRPYRFVAIALALPAGLWLSVTMGPWVEKILFAGDIKAWLDGQVGKATGGWFFLLIPLCTAATVYLVGETVNPFLRRHSQTWSRAQAGWIEIAKLLLGVAFTLIAAWMLAVFFNDLGLDPRGSILKTYDQRNALVVGFVMGFAIIPIIYTIAEDSLSSVPDHLRSASLGAGATPWQTAVRIIVPTAMSGLFAAVMVGLGRAIGETMIVLMAAGNTPVIDWNIFNGFRTLSANIAVELPEAVRNSTHYRTLFLAALTLFVMTFILNSIAEIIRLRFRKRSYQL